MTRRTAPTAAHAGRLALALVISLSAQLLVVRPTLANTRASLQCIDSTGVWRVYLPTPGTRTTNYWSKFAYKFEGAWAGTGYDWRYSNEWFWGDYGNGAFWTAAGGIVRLPADSWAYSGTVNSGKMIVWEYQYFPDSGAFAWEKVGECVIFQIMPFIPTFT